MLSVFQGFGHAAATDQLGSALVMNSERVADIQALVLAGGDDSSRAGVHILLGVSFFGLRAPRDCAT
jgi:hypothetical protein